jgi:hypothetical protein
MVSAEDPRLVDTDILVEATVIGWRMRDVGNDVSLAETSVTIAAPPKHFPVRCLGASPGRPRRHARLIASTKW